MQYLTLVPENMVLTTKYENQNKNLKKGGAVRQTAPLLILQSEKRQIWGKHI